LSYLIRLRPENIIIELKNGAGTCDNKYPLWSSEMTIGNPEKYEWNVSKNVRIFSSFIYVYLHTYL
jgi:hypothetical protein